jgi:hypothetical protein
MTQQIEWLGQQLDNELLAKNLARCLRPLCEAVLFSNCETSRVGQFRAMEGLLRYCDDTDRQKQVLDRLAEVD